jgi:DeoR/GlpR family transcriptional regulator of sugar metabolism
LQNREIDVTCTGGSADGEYYSLTGSVAERALYTHYYDVAVIGVNGISASAGLTVNSQANAVVLSIMIEQSRKCIVVSDHSKFDQICFAHLAHLDCIDTLVTDARPPAALYDALRRLRVKVVIAGEGD